MSINMNKLLIGILFLAGVILMLFILLNWHTLYLSHQNLKPTPSPSNTLANPASVNCTKVGGTLLIKTRGDGGQYGLCDFGDNMQCEEWALLRGDCPVGGRKTTGFDSIEEKYCAWLGGQTYAVPNATCTLPNGHICKDTDLYNGICL